MMTNNTTYYHTCPDCGANLDPQEQCTCNRSRAVAMKKNLATTSSILDKAPKVNRNEVTRKTKEFLSVLLNGANDIKKESRPYFCLGVAHILTRQNKHLFKQTHELLKEILVEQGLL